jgi:hypothetical protein
LSENWRNTSLVKFFTVVIKKQDRNLWLHYTPFVKKYNALWLWMEHLQNRWNRISSAILLNLFRSFLNNGDIYIIFKYFLNISHNGGNI